MSAHHRAAPSGYDHDPQHETTSCHEVDALHAEVLDLLDIPHGPYVRCTPAMWAMVQRLIDWRNA